MDKTAKQYKDSLGRSTAVTSETHPRFERTGMRTRPHRRAAPGTSPCLRRRHRHRDTGVNSSVLYKQPHSHNQNQTFSHHPARHVSVIPCVKLTGTVHHQCEQYLPPTLALPELLSVVHAIHLESPHCGITSPSKNSSAQALSLVVPPSPTPLHSFTSTPRTRHHPALVHKRAAPVARMRSSLHSTASYTRAPLLYTHALLPPLSCWSAAPPPRWSPAWPPPRPPGTAGTAPSRRRRQACSTSSRS